MFTTEAEYKDFQKKSQTFHSHAEVCLRSYADARLKALKQLLEIENELDIQDTGDSTTVEYAIQQVSNVNACSFDTATDTVVRFSGSVPACRRGCCGYTDIVIRMPVRCLWDTDNIEDIVRDEIAEMRKDLEEQLVKRKEAERLEAEEQAKQQEISDREEFERLSAKFKQ